MEVFIIFFNFFFLFIFIFTFFYNQGGHMVPTNNIVEKPEETFHIISSFIDSKLEDT